jgi:hypothetical protein
MPHSLQAQASRQTITALWVVFVVFCMRVIGQLSVVLWQPSWLPPMEEWYSGLLPYPYLLPFQILVIIIMVNIATGVTRRRGIFVRSRPPFSRPVMIFALVYLGVMVVRYIIRMSTMPDERWVGGCIPIFMHWGLAFFLIVFARYRNKIEMVAREGNAAA